MNSYTSSVISRQWFINKNQPICLFYFPSSVATTAAPTSADTVVAVVIVLILLTVAALGVLLYRYLCHNKGDYRTTGEPAPGEDPDDEQNNQAVSEKKEYFI
uniref:Si:ch211-210c8.7 n=1 Tax=Cyclopterus lumpus TaxID=8103 RepID=A0A8C3ADN9_CYCLU